MSTYLCQNDMEIQRCLNYSASKFLDWTNSVSLRDAEVQKRVIKRHNYELKRLDARIEKEITENEDGAIRERNSKIAL